MTASLTTRDERADWLRDLLADSLSSSYKGGRARERLSSAYRHIAGVPLFLRLLDQADECEGASTDAPEWMAATGLSHAILASYVLITHAEANAQAAARCHAHA